LKRNLSSAINSPRDEAIATGSTMSKLNAHTCEMMHYTYSPWRWISQTIKHGESVYVCAPERGIIAPLTLKCTGGSGNHALYLCTRFVFIKTHASAFFSFHRDSIHIHTAAARFGAHTHGGAVNNL
jgi:hypothetical protein